MRIKNFKSGIPSKQSEYNNYSSNNFHPFLQHQNHPSDNYQYPDLNINSEGFRGKEISKKKPDDVFRVFILGGSTVYNKKTPYELNVSRILEKKLAVYYKNIHFEVLNAGADGYTSEHSLIQYLFKIKDFNPDLIIMWHGINDMTASCTPKEFTIGTYKPDYSHLLGPLHNMFYEYYSEKPILSLLTLDYIKHFLATSFYSDILESIYKSQKTLIKPAGKPKHMNFQSVESYKRNLQSLINSVKADNISLILGNQPYLYNKKLDLNHYWDIQWLCKTVNTYPDIDSILTGINAFNDATKNIAENNNIPFVDIEGKIPKNDKYFSDDVHFYKAPGNKIVADELFNKILDENLVEMAIIN